jgi:hypothetical protein
MRDLLGVYLEIAEKILERLAKGGSFWRLQESTWKWIDQKGPHIARLAETFH